MSNPVRSVIQIGLEASLVLLDTPMFGQHFSGHIQVTTSPREVPCETAKILFKTFRFTHNGPHEIFIEGREAGEKEKKEICEERKRKKKKKGKGKGKGKRKEGNPVGVLLSSLSNLMASSTYILKEERKEK